MPDQQDSKQKNRWWIFSAAGLFMVTKGKQLLTLLKLSKIGGPLLSLLLSIGAYAVLFPFEFAIGLVAMLFIHEMGHVIAAKQKGLPVSAPVFIPFLGALIMMKKHPRDAETEAYLAFGGPLLGTLGATIAYLMSLLFDSVVLLMIANIGFFLNLINLLPIHPLDGGRISVAVTRWLWLVGLVGGLVVIIFLGSPLFFVIWAMFAWELYQKYVRHKKKDKTFSAVSKMVIPLDELVATGAMIPGEEHRRELPYSTYSTLTGQQKVTIRWDGLERVINLPTQTQALIQRVKVARIEQSPNDAPDQLVIHVQIEYDTFSPEDYYEVPTSVRWKFGLSYVGLALFLFMMMVAAYHQGAKL